MAKPFRFHSPLDAQRTVIAVMRQHPGLFPDQDDNARGHQPSSRRTCVNAGPNGADLRSITDGFCAARSYIAKTLTLKK
jgi:hypothetical protein